MATVGKFNVSIYKNKKLVRYLSNVRDNGRFRALRRYLDLTYGDCIVNLYDRGKFIRQVKYTKGGLF